MTNGRAYNLKDGHKLTPLLVAIIGAVIGSGGGVYISLRSPLGQEIARPDPFTGSQGATLASRIEQIQTDLTDIKITLNRDMTRHEERLNNLQRHHEELEVEFDEWVKYHNENFVPAKHLEPKRN